MKEFLILLLVLPFRFSKPLVFDVHYTKSFPFNSRLASFFEMGEVTYKKGLPAITLSLGEPPQTFEFLITTFSSKTYVISKDNGYNCSLSSTCKDKGTEISLKFIGNDVKGQLMSDVLRFNKIKISNFHFVLISKGTYGYIYKGMIGLDYLARENDRDIKNPIPYSFLSTLYTTGRIYKQMFSFGKIGKSTKLLLGDYPTQKLNFKNFRSCHLFNKNSEDKYENIWKCKLNKIYFDDYEVYSVEDYIAFGLSGNVLSVNEEFFKYLVNKYFDEPIKKGNCSVNTEFLTKQIWCKANFNTKYIGTINLIIGKWTLKLDSSKLWVNLPKFGQKAFSVVFYVEKKYNWAIHYELIKDKFFMTFDREKDLFGLVRLDSLQDIF